MQAKCIERTGISGHTPETDTGIKDLAKSWVNKYYFSDLLNWDVFENLTQAPYSIWAYVSDVVPQAERALLPEMAES